jgi:predicted DNA-binding protein YlxM (UPF0122 family)
MVDKNKKDQYVRLMDLYGKTLPKAEFEVASDYLYYELSISEIASQRGVSRQAVEKRLTSALKKLSQMEQRIGFLGFIDKLTDTLPETEMNKIISILEENDNV